MAPTRATRHETSGAGPPDNPDDRPAAYGTRAKRKASDNLEEESSNGQNPSKTTSPVASKKQKVAESKPAPPKKRIGGQRTKPSKIAPPSTPSDEDQSSVSPIPEPVPEIALGGPSGTSEEPSQKSSGEPSEEPSEETSDQPSQALALSTPFPQILQNPQDPQASQAPLAFNGSWVEPPSTDTYLPPSMPSSPRKGGFRGRGFPRGGRAGRGGRGGRPPKGFASERATPAPSNGIVKIGRGGTRGRAKKHTSAELKAYSRRKDDLRQLYRSVVQQQRLVLVEVAERSEKMTREDANFHKGLPEYGNVLKKLGERRDQVFSELDGEYENEKDYLDREEKIIVEITDNIFKVSRKGSSVLAGD